MSPTDTLYAADVLEWSFWQAATKYGFSVPDDAKCAESDPQTEVYPCGSGALTITRREWATYVSVGFPDRDFRGYREAYRLFCRNLERYGALVAVVHPRNLPSVRLVVKLGGVPLGIDPEGFIHYKIEQVPHAKPTETA